MKTAFAIAICMVMCGCSTAPKGFVLPVGTKIIFAYDNDATDFRSATLMDPTRIGRVVTLDKPLTVTQ